MNKVTNLLPNEVYALQCIQRYREDGIIVDKSNGGEWSHCPTPECLGGTKGYYLTHYDHMIQGLIQSQDHDHLCFWTADTKLILEGNFFPYYDWFSLWEIYDKYASWGWRFITNHSAGGTETHRKGVGIWSMTPEQKREAGRKGGLKGGPSKKPGNGRMTKYLKYISLIDGYISTAAGVVSYHKGKKWDTSMRIPVNSLEAPPHSYSGYV